MNLFGRKKRKLTTHPKEPQSQQKKSPPSIPEGEHRIPRTEIKKQQKHSPKDARRLFLQTFREFSGRRSQWEIWMDFVTMFACAISNAVDKSNYDEREKLYLKTIRKYEKREQYLFPELSAHTIMALEDNPEQDFLGSIFMELGLGNKGSAQFFTPYHICQLMAAVTEGDLVAEVKEKGYITVNDPCCGAGATLIAAVNEAKHTLAKANLNFQNHILIVGQDIDWTAVMMCYIQLSLLGVAGYFKVGNSLTDPLVANEAAEKCWFTPMYSASQVWSYRRTIQNMSTLTGGDNHES